MSFVSRKREIRCGDPNHVCCKVKDRIEDHAQSHHPKGCGYRNPNGVSFKIVGQNSGESQFGEFPWMVAIKQNDLESQERCGGSLIHPQAVLTAAHCVTANESYYIRAGDWDTDSTKEPYQHEDVAVHSIIIHSNFTPGPLFNDIALLLLKYPVKLGPHIETICLPPQNYETHIGRCFSSGWGKIASGYKDYFPHIMKKVSVFQLPRDLCLHQLRKTRLSKYFELHHSFICAGGEEGNDTCQGDGGSPLMCPIEGEISRYYQAGIVSWGIGCGQKHIPGVYVDVSLFRNWIDQHMKNHGLSADYYTF